MSIESKEDPLYSVNKQTNDAIEQLKIQIQENDSKKIQQKALYPTVVKQGKLELQKLKDYEKRLKSEKVQLQNEYSSALSNQLNIQKNNEMTQIGIEHREKPAMNAMIPGIYNIESVGSRPILRTGAIISYSPQSISKKYLNVSNPVGGKYNTITNPIPQTSSNPYLIKEAHKLKQ